MAVFTVIDHTEVGAGGAAYWAKTSIPTDGTYDHLLIKASLRGEYAGRYNVSLSLTVNGVNSSVYSDTAFYAAAAAITSTRENARAQLVGAEWPANDALAGTFGDIEMWIPHYANSTNYKPFIVKAVAPNNSTTDSQWYLGAMAGLYAQTTAISSIKIASGHGDDLEQYSTITLYGITGV